MTGTAILAALATLLGACELYDRLRRRVRAGREPVAYSVRGQAVGLRGGA